MNPTLVSSLPDSDHGCSLPAEHHSSACAGRRASLSPAARRGGGHLDSGWQVLRYGTQWVVVRRSDSGLL